MVCERESVRLFAGGKAGRIGVVTLLKDGWALVIFGQSPIQPFRGAKVTVVFNTIAATTIGLANDTHFYETNVQWSKVADLKPSGRKCLGKLFLELRELSYSGARALILPKGLQVDMFPVPKPPPPREAQQELRLPGVSAPAAASSSAAPAPAPADPPAPAPDKPAPKPTK